MGCKFIANRHALEVVFSEAKVAFSGFTYLTDPLMCGHKSNTYTIYHSFIAPVQKQECA